MAVYDAATTEAVTPALDGYPFKVVYRLGRRRHRDGLGDQGSRGRDLPTISSPTTYPRRLPRRRRNRSAPSVRVPVGDPMDT